MPGVRITGKRRRAGPHRDPAVSAASSSKDGNRASEDADLDTDIGPSLGSLGNALSSREEDEAAGGEEEVPPELADPEDEEDLWIPATAREKRIAVLDE